MAADNYLNKYAIASDDPVTPTEHNNSGTGVQREFELRMAAGNLLPGFETGGSAPTLSGTTALSLPAQTAYALTGGRMKRFTAAALRTFSASDANATYLIFLDTSAEALAVTTGTVDETEDLLVAQAAWADPTLSAVVDKRKFGLLPHIFTGRVAGTLAASTTAAVDVRLIPSGYKFQFDENPLEGCLGAPGSANTVYADIHAGSAGTTPATIFTTQTDRLTIPYNTATLGAVSSGVPLANRLLTGPAVIELYVDLTATDATNLSWTIKGRLFPA